MKRCLIFLLACALGLPPAQAYSVLTHEAIIDDSWPAVIRPLLLRRFPSSTEDQLREAHAYAYGGAIIQDMGYYPFGSKFFSDLTHYVRSGDFVDSLLREARDLDEYAFALGSAAHYSADNQGHSVAINRTVPMMYPRLRAKFGDDVTYEDDPAAHLKTEFAFDVVQIARGRYKPEAYHDFIGFQVSKPLLERAFQTTYSLSIDQVFHNIDRALGTYRFAVSSMIPEMTKAAWAAKKDDIAKLQAGMTRRSFVYRYSRRNYERDWKRNYDRPGPGARFLAWLFRLLPKIGPLKVFAFKVPTPAAEKLFLQSFGDSKSSYRTLLADAASGPPHYPNDNFDTGRLVRRGDYHLADQTYDKLLDTLSDKSDPVSAALGSDILAFYGPGGEPASPKARALLLALRKQALAATAGAVAPLHESQEFRK